MKGVNNLDDRLYSHLKNCPTAISRYMRGSPSNTRHIKYGIRNAPGRIVKVGMNWELETYVKVGLKLLREIMRDITSVALTSSMFMAKVREPPDIA